MGRVAYNLAHILPICRHPPANTLSSDTWRPGEDRHSAAPEAVRNASLQISHQKKKKKPQTEFWREKVW